MGIWYYAGGEASDGTPVFDGPHTTDQKAHEAGEKLLEGLPFKVYKYNTYDYDRAKASWKHDRAMESGVGIGLKPVFRKPPKSADRQQYDENVVYVE